MTPTVGERNLKEVRLREIRGLFAQENYHVFFWACCWFQGKLHRLNGQHSSTVLADLEEFPTNVQAVVETYEASSLEEMAFYYNWFDTSGSVRSLGDVIRAIVRTLPDYDGLPLPLLNRVATVVVHDHLDCIPIVGGQERKRVSHRLRQQCLQRASTKRFARWLYDNGLWVKRAETKFHTTAVLQAVYQTYLVDEDAALEFWSKVVFGTEIPASCRRK
jgi:hypothetical protein